MKRVRQLSLVSLCLLLTVDTVAQPKSTDLRTSINNLVQEERKLDFKGSVLVSKGEQILHVANYGLEVDQNYSYWIGSLSKQFCAASILKLQEKGLLSVSDPISKYIGNAPTHVQDITVHQLLTHSSGLANNYAADGIAEQAKALDALLASKLVPLSTYGYSNDGYQLLAILVELVSGQTYEEFLQNEFFEPLGMSATGFSGDQQKSATLTIPPSRKNRSDNPQNWASDYGYKGSTGILTSVQDLMTWKLALFDNRVLGENSTNSLFKRHVKKTSELFYGYGWNIFDSSNGEVIVHSGQDDFIDHNSTFRHYSDSDITIIVLTSDGDFKGTGKARVLASKIVSLIFY